MHGAATWTCLPAKDAGGFASGNKTKPRLEKHAPPGAPEAERGGDRFVCDLAIADIEPRGETRIIVERRQAFVGELHDEGQRSIVECLGGRCRDRSGHVGHAVVNDAFDFEGRIGMCGGPGRLETAALVDGDITIVLDIAKSVFQVYGVDAAGNVLIRRKLKRR